MQTLCFRPQHTPAPARDRGIDALRGFALMGVVVVNAPIFAMPIDAGPVLATPADRIAAWATLAFGAGKFFLIFSFLYGFGLSVALDRAAHPGGSGAPLRRRLVALFANRHGACDAPVLRRHPDALRAARRRARRPARRGAAAAGGDRGGEPRAGGLHAVGNHRARARRDESHGPIERIAGVGYLGGLARRWPRGLADLPSALVFLLAFNGPARSPWCSPAGSPRAPARSRRSRRDLARLARIAPAVLAIAGTASGLAAAVLVAALASPGSVDVRVTTLAAVVVCLAAPALSLATAAILLAAATRHPDALAIRAFACVGESSLSGYLLHSLLLGGVFLGWGPPLGHWGALDAAAVLAVSLGVYAAIVGFLSLWRRAFALGRRRCCCGPSSPGAPSPAVAARERSRRSARRRRLLHLDMRRAHRDQLLRRGGVHRHRAVEIRLGGPIITATPASWIISGAASRPKMCTPITRSEPCSPRAS